MRQRGRGIEREARRKGAMALVALALLLALGGCAGRGERADRGQERAIIALNMNPATPSSAPTQLIVQLTTPEGTPLTGARVTVEGDMSHAGMQPVNGEAREQGNGSYIVDNFHFTMGGDWVLIVRATLADGTQVQQTFPLDGVAGMVERAPLPRA